MDVLENFLVSNAQLLGVARDNFALLFCVILTIPLSAVIPHLPGVLKHAYSIIWAFFFFTVVFDLKYGFLQLLVMSLGTYACCKYATTTTKPFAWFPSPWPWLIFWLVMLQLTVNHSIRYFSNTSVDTMEISGSMMVLTQRLTLFAWKVYDQMETNQGKSNISLLPFLGFCFFLPAFLVGPGIHYDSYLTQTRSPLPPGRIQVSLARFATGVFFLLAYARTAGIYRYSAILEDPFLAVHPVKQIVFANLCGLTARLKYYGIWKVAEAACIMSGAAQTGNPDKMWDGAMNVIIPNIEFAPNWKVLLDSWNCFTNVWLREAVYKRLAAKGKKPGFKTTMLTFGTSAFWHGVNVSYYLSFLLGGFLQALGRNLRKYVRPFFLSDQQLLNPKDDSIASPPQKAYYDIAGIIFTQLTLNYTVIPFILLDIKSVLIAWSRLGWYGHALTFGPSLFFWLGGGRILARNLKVRSDKLAKYHQTETANKGHKDVSIVSNPSDVSDALNKKDL